MKQKDSNMAERGGGQEIQSLQNLDRRGLAGHSEVGFAMRRMGMTSVLMFSKEIWPCLVPTAWQGSRWRRSALKTYKMDDQKPPRLFLKVEC